MNGGIFISKKECSGSWWRKVRSMIGFIGTSENLSLVSVRVVSLTIMISMGYLNVDQKDLQIQKKS